METIAQSFVNFQKELRPVNKDSENPFFKSSYADLSSILQSVVPLLTKHGLSVTQPMRIDGTVTILCTRILHTSGEFFSSEMILPHNPDPQKFGSLITYYKRYQLQALLGVSTKDEDDDANSSYDNEKYHYPTRDNSEKPKKEFQKNYNTDAVGAASAAQIATVKKLYGEKTDITNMTRNKASDMITAYNKGLNK